MVYVNQTIKVWCTKRYIVFLYIASFVILMLYFITKYKTNHHVKIFKDVLSCYKQKIPQNVFLLEADKDYEPPKGTIFFIETSCNGCLSSRQACAVESTAKTNPDRLVTILLVGPLNAEFQRGKLFKKLYFMPNVEFRRINVTEFAKGTQLENVFRDDKISKSQYAVVHSSDILRILTLYKYGGMYLDLDFIVMKSFSDFPQNFVAKQTLSCPTNSILGFTKDKLAKYFLEFAVRDLATTYNPRGWASNGPELIMRTLKKTCSEQNLEKMTNSTCNGLHVLESKLFFPIYYPSWRKYFEDSKPEPSEAYTHHLWNKFSHNINIPKNSLYSRLAERYCPEVYTLYGDKFGT